MHPSFPARRPERAEARRRRRRGGRREPPRRCRATQNRLIVAEPICQVRTNVPQASTLSACRDSRAASRPAGGGAVPRHLPRRTPSVSASRPGAGAGGRDAPEWRGSRARPGARARGSAAGASASALPSAATMKACAGSPSGKLPASQAAQTTPPAAPEKPTRCSDSPHDAQPASCGANPAASRSFRRKASALARVACAASPSSSASLFASRW